MKPDYNSIISSFIFLFLLHVPQITKATASEFPVFPKVHSKCEDAVRMDCEKENDHISHFINEYGDAILNQESCIQAVNGQGVMTEYWLSVHLSGSNLYYLDGYGVNAGIEVYKGSCDELGMIQCESAMGDDTFIELSPDGSVDYFIRLLGYDTSDKDQFEVVLNCGEPEPACEISIDSVEVGECVSSEGTVSVFMSGFVDPEPEMPLIFAEVMTDAGLYMFSGESVNGLWEASFEVSGTVVTYVSVFCGNSETGCGSSLAGMDLPTQPCTSVLVPVFTGSIAWGATCGQRSGEIRLYEPGTDILLETYSVLVLSNGLFEIEDAPSGIYDVILNVNGFLPKGFPSVEVSLTEDSYGFGALKRGDINGDGVVDMADVNILIEWFGSILPGDGSLNYLDQNCDGIINILDISSLVASLNQVGDTVPLE